MTFNEAMNQLLQQRKYDRLMGRALDIKKILYQMIEKVLEWIFDHLHLKAPQSGSYDTSVIRNIFIAVTVVVVLAVAAVIVLAIKRRKKRTKTMEEIFEELKNKNLTLDDLMRISEDFAGKGDLRESVRYAYIALLWLLNSKNIIYLDHAKTNGQLKREVARNAPQLSKRFYRAVDVFNHTWFGHKSISQEQFDAYTSELEVFMKSEVQGYEK